MNDMNDITDKLIFIDKNLEDRMNQNMKSFIKNRMQENAKLAESLYVIYVPDCECDVEMFYVLDRYPMSEKIHSFCPYCNKHTLMSISDPIRFHLPLINKDYSLKELKRYVVTDTWQADYIKAYQNE